MHPGCQCCSLATRVDLDGTPLVLDAGSTRREFTRRAMAVLRQVKPRIIGAVLNRVPAEGWGCRYNHCYQCANYCTSGPGGHNGDSPDGRGRHCRAARRRARRIRRRQPASGVMISACRHSHCLLRRNLLRPSDKPIANPVAVRQRVSDAGAVLFNLGKAASVGINPSEPQASRDGVPGPPLTRGIVAPDEGERGLTRGTNRRSGFAVSPDSVAEPPILGASVMSLGL